MNLTKYPKALLQAAVERSFEHNNAMRKAARDGTTPPTADSNCNPNNLRLFAQTCSEEQRDTVLQRYLGYLAHCQKNLENKNNPHFPSVSNEHDEQLL